MNYTIALSFLFVLLNLFNKNGWINQFPQNVFEFNTSHTADNIILGRILYHLMTANWSVWTIPWCIRAIPPAYEDGVSEPRSGYDGYPLPSPRAVTAVVHTEENFIDHAATTLVVSWGQFMDHDFTLTGTLLSECEMPLLLISCTFSSQLVGHCEL